LTGEKGGKKTPPAKGGESVSLQGNLAFYGRGESFLGEPSTILGKGEGSEPLMRLSHSRRGKEIKILRGSPASGGGGKKGRGGRDSLVS